VVLQPVTGISTQLLEKLQCTMRGTCTYYEKNGIFFLIVLLCLFIEMYLCSEIMFLQHQLSYMLPNTVLHQHNFCKITSKKITVGLPQVLDQPLALPELPKREHRDLKDLLESDPYALLASLPVQTENHYVFTICLLNNIIFACLNMCLLFNRMNAMSALLPFLVYPKIEFGGTKHVMHAQTNHRYRCQHVQLADQPILFLGCYPQNIHVYHNLFLLFTW
jgi:hypothetical protein